MSQVEHFEERDRYPITASVSMVLLLSSPEGCQIVLGQKANDGRWTLVGGGMGPRETPFEALRREWQEETGSSLGEQIDLARLPPDVVTSFRSDHTSLGLVYLGTFIGDRLPQPPSGSELVRLKAFTPSELRQLLTQAQTSLYRPDMNFDNLATLLGILSPQELTLLCLHMKARSRTQKFLQEDTYY